jgi:Fur family transcriptional regulator, peroxide stress response regulator
MGEIQDRTELIVKKLKEKGHRITPQRLTIVRMLVESQGHPSVDDIFEKVKINFPTTSLATVYKTVSVLKELGELVSHTGYRILSHRLDFYGICPECQKKL